MYDIFTIGHIKLDTFILVEDANVSCELKMPACQLCLEYGKKIPVEDIETQIAGSAPNVAIGLARMKKTTCVYSQMGKDILHRLAIDFLTSEKVETKFVKATAGIDTSFAAVLNFKGESTQLVSHNGIEYRLPARMPKTKWVHVSEQGRGYEKLYRDLVKLVKDKGVKISFNPGVVQIEERKPAFTQLLKKTYVLFVNRSEAEDLVQSKGKIEMHNLMAELKAMGPEYIVITDGRNGAYAFDGKQLDYAPMFPGKRVEATGAGDSFATGFLGALMYENSHAEALRWGSVNAASVVNEIGPTKGLLTHTEIKKRLKANPDYKTEEL